MRFRLYFYYKKIQKGHFLSNKKNAIHVSALKPNLRLNVPYIQLKFTTSLQVDAKIQLNTSSSLRYSVKNK